MAIRLTPDMLNKAYYDIKESVKINPFTVIYGGRNSGKSHSTMQWLLVECWNTGRNAIFYRATSADLRTKAYDPLLRVATDMGMRENLHPVFHNLAREIKFPKSNKILFDFVDAKEARAKGISGITYIILEEADQISKAGFLHTISSFRGDPNIRFIVLFNPVDISNYLYPTFFDNPTDSPTHLSKLSGIYRYTIDDNKYATQMDYDLLDTYKDIDENLYNVYRYGDWGTISTEDPFINNFKPNNNITKHLLLNTDYRLFVSFDFGKTDSCVVGQVFEDYEAGDDSIGLFTDTKGGIKILAEYRVGNAQSNVVEIVHRIIQDFGTDCDYIVTGDVAGGGNKGVNELYYEVKNEFENLGAYFVRYIKMTKPSHKSSRRLVNWCFRYYEKNFKINEICTDLIRDLKTVPVDEFGNIDKQYCIKHDRGHLMDCLRYMLEVSQKKNFLSNNPQLKQDAYDISENI
jgi:phage terminase large subunit